MCLLFVCVLPHPTSSLKQIEVLNREKFEKVKAKEIKAYQKERNMSSASEFGFEFEDIDLTPRLGQFKER